MSVRAGIASFQARGRVERMIENPSFFDGRTSTAWLRVRADEGVGSGRFARRTSAAAGALGSAPFAEPAGQRSISRLAG
jgi:hypothetical protein